jgi:hypothetical protein
MSGTNRTLQSSSHLRVGWMQLMMPATLKSPPAEYNLPYNQIPPFANHPTCFSRLSHPPPRSVNDIVCAGDSLLSNLPIEAASALPYIAGCSRSLSSAAVIAPAAIWPGSPPPSAMAAAAAGLREDLVAVRVTRGGRSQPTRHSHSTFLRYHYHVLIDTSTDTITS